MTLPLAYSSRSSLGANKPRNAAMTQEEDKIRPKKLERVQGLSPRPHSSLHMRPEHNTKLRGPAEAFRDSKPDFPDLQECHRPKPFDLYVTLSFPSLKAQKAKGIAI